MHFAGVVSVIDGHEWVRGSSWEGALGEAIRTDKITVSKPRFCNIQVIVCCKNETMRNLSQ